MLKGFSIVVAFVVGGLTMHVVVECLHVVSDSFQAAKHGCHLVHDIQEAPDNWKELRKVHTGWCVR